MTPQQVLMAAADYIEQHGWCVRSYRKGQRVCAVGAINAVTTGNPSQGIELSYEAEMLLYRYVAIPVSRWNDAQPDAATVVAALRQAAGGQT